MVHGCLTFDLGLASLSVLRGEGTMMSRKEERGVNVCVYGGKAGSEERCRDHVERQEFFPRFEDPEPRNFFTWPRYSVAPGLEARAFSLQPNLSL